MANGSFYQNGLPISSVETGVGNLPTTHPPANPASSSFYLSGSVYQTLANQDALLATITADTALVVTDLGLANTAASNAAASAAAAAATLASALLIANNLSDLASVPTALTNLGLNNVNNTSDVNKPVSTAQATADALVASNAAAATSSLSSSTTASLALKAPLASPALTGVPTAPTAAALTNSTQLSTTAYADAAVSTLSGTTTTALALKAPLASPALTGVPTAPTATAGTNTTQIASTAFVAASVSSGVTNIGGQIGALTISGGALASTVIPVPRYDAAQSLTAAQQNQAQSNLGTLGRNRFINGNFSIDQRNAGASQSVAATGNAVYTVDRWYGRVTGAAVTGQRIAGTGSYRYSYRFTGATSNTTVVFGQRIIADNVADLVSKSVVVKAELSSSTITSLTWTSFFANAANNFSANTQIATGTITINSTPTDYSFTFNTGSSAANGIVIEFSCGALLGTQTLTFGGDIQLEAGTIATAFDYKLPRGVLFECQAYYQPFSVGFNIYGVSGSNFGGTQSFPVAMTKAPTVTANSSPNTNAGTTTIDRIAAASMRAYANCTVTGAIEVNCNTNLEAEY
jgi:hypothetical protein